MEEKVIAVMDDGFSNLDIILAVIGVGGLLRMAYVGGKLVGRAARIIESANEGAQC